MVPSLKILVVDDSHVHLVVVRAWLESVGCEVLTHASSLGAASMVFREKPDVVLLDSVACGDELQELLGQASSGELQIIFHSASESSAELARTAPCLGFIRKTNDGDDFLGRFRSLVDGIRPRSLSGDPALA